MSANPWNDIEAIRKQGRELKSQLEAIGWRLLETDGIWIRAKKNGGRNDVWREVKAKKPDELLEGINAETKRVEERKKQK